MSVPVDRVELRRSGAAQLLLHQVHLSLVRHAQALQLLHSICINVARPKAKLVDNDMLANHYF